MPGVGTLTLGIYPDGVVSHRTWKVLFFGVEMRYHDYMLKVIADDIAVYSDDIFANFSDNQAFCVSIYRTSDDICRLEIGVNSNCLDDAFDIVRKRLTQTGFRNYSIRV